MSELSKPRRTTIRVQRADGSAISGATIEVRLAGELAATIISSGESTVELDGDDSIDLIASIGGISTSMSIDSSDSEVTLIIPITRFFELASEPRAQCPDGTSGQPCVTCNIEGRQIRVCA